MKADSYKLRMLMARQGVRACDIIKSSGIHPSTFTHVMNECNLRPATLGKIARALAVDVSEIMKEV